MKQYIAPSIICGNRLNLEAEIQELNRSDADLIHFDVMDTTFTPMDPTTCLSPDLIPLFRKRTNIPLDIHIEINEPYNLICNILPYCEGCYIQVHIECCSKISHYIDLIRKGGAYPAIALNCGTSLELIRDVIEEVDLIDLCTTNSKNGSHAFTESLQRKIRKAREMTLEVGRKDMIIEVDGGINFERAEKCKILGANAYVLGTKSVYNQNKSVSEKINEFRKFIEK